MLLTVVERAEVKPASVVNGVTNLPVGLGVKSKAGVLALIRTRHLQGGGKIVADQDRSGGRHNVE